MGNDVGRRGLCVFGAVLAGALLLLWPALLNGYPILFSDTQAFLVQGGRPFMLWDKPFVYGPFLAALHAHVSLWGPALAQGVMLSALLWLVGDALDRISPPRHVLVCAILAVGSAAPWSASLLMPDVFTSAAVLCIWLLGFSDRLSCSQRVAVVILGAFAVATHLAHLPMAAAAILPVVVLRWRRTAPAALPLVLAVAVLLTSNVVGFGRFSLSPYGSVFALARLSGDGLVAGTLARDCPQAGWRLCEWQGRLNPDSDRFLWDKDGPVWSTPGGPIALAPEASAIVNRTIARVPLAVARAMLGNAWAQLWRVKLGDTLTADSLGAALDATIAQYLPASDLARFRASRQSMDTLAPVAAPLNTPHAVLLVVGVVVTLVLLVRGPPQARALAATILLALLANAATTGALSGPHDRYQARLTWLVLLPGMMLMPPVSRPRPGSYAPASRNPSAASR